MRRCRKCNKEWPDTTNVCPDDGFSLTMEVEATVAPVTGSGGPISAGISAAMAAIQQPEPEPEEFQMGTDLVPGFVVGEYKVDKKIGEGGMGAVYSATHPMIGKRAAIKVISSALGNDASAVGRFIQEARSVNQIGHPNIVDVFAFGELPDGRNYFVMEYLQGESLADRINKAAMPLGEAIEILDQVADGLEAAHEKQIVHRDLKPDNVYLASVRGGRTMVKLLDFGIAKLSTPDGSGSGGGIQKTRTGMMMGTPGYISPEQARGKNVDYRTDIYALGCMVFEIACGRLPFVADNAMDIVLMHMTQEAPRASEVWPEIPPPLDEIISRMLQKEPSARPSLQEVRAVFAELVTSGLVTLTAGKGVAFGSGMRSNLNTPRPQTGVQSAVAVGTSPGAVPPSTQTGPVPIQAPPPSKKTGLIAAIVGGVLVVGGVGGFLAMKGGGDKQPPKVAETAPAPVPEAPKPEAPKPEAPKPEAPKPEVTVKQPGTIVIAINVEQATVSVDGNPVPVTGKTATAKVDLEGEHLVSVTAEGRDPYETTVKTKAGDSVSVVAMLPKAAKKPSGSGTKTTKTTTAAAGTKTTPTGTTQNTTTTTTTTATPVDKNATVDPFAN